MKVNYNLVMEDIINNLETKPKLLLHACCGVCSSSVLERLIPYFDITVLFYNPNIYPASEYQKRLDVLKEYINKAALPVKILETDYRIKDFYQVVKGLENEKEGGLRCDKCYFLRLEETAKIAKEKGYDYFCTTLSVSPYKKATTLNEIGKRLEQQYQVKYLYSDFKKKEGYKRSNELAKKYGLYRQHYCGCEFSLNDTTVK